MTLTVYTFEVVEGQEWIFPVDESHLEMFLAMDGKVISNWNPLAMKVNREIDHEEACGQPSLNQEKTFYSDFPWLGEHVSFLRKPAVDALRHLLLNYGQVLPVGGEEVWLFNVTTVLDALDRERSQIVYFNDGDVLAIERYVFDRSKIGTATIFKLPMRASPVFVTNIFVDQVHNAGLRGVAFKALWTHADR